MRLALSMVLLAAACGSSSSGIGADGGATPDAAPAADAAPPGDAPPPPLELTRIDWRETRGPAIPTTTATVPAAVTLHAVHAGGFVTRSGCSQEKGCTLTWRDRDGALVRERAGLVAATATTVSPDGTRALLVAADEVAPCGAGDTRPIVARGLLQLLDLATGEVELELPLRTNLWSALGFSPDGTWFFSAPLAGEACQSTGYAHRAVAAPHARAPGLGDGDAFVSAIDATRWFVWRGQTLGLVDPARAGSFVALVDDSPERFDATGGWVHVVSGFGELAQDVLSISPSGTRHMSVFRDEDWFPFGTWGRWIRVCEFRHPDGYRDCRIADATGEVAPIQARVSDAPEHHEDGVLLDGAFVFVGPVEGGELAVQRIDLISGRVEILHAGAGALRPLGDGEAALLTLDGAVWLIERDREERVATGVTGLVTAPRILDRPWLRQDELAVLTVALAEPGEFSLQVLDLRTRRLATLTDHLHHAPHLDFPTFFDECGQPWTTRTAGAVPEGLFQDPRALFFVEEGTPATVWLVPVDLSAPPRQLAALTSNPIGCRAPLVSPDGTRAAVAEEIFDGTTRVIVGEL